MSLSKCLNHGQWPLLLLSPGVCFVSSIIKIRKGEIKACWAIPFIMGLIAYLFPPFADFARTEDGIIELLDLPLGTVIALRGDIVITSIEYFFLKNGIPIEIFRFLYTFIGYYFITKIFVDIVNKSKLSRQSVFFVWLFLFLLIEFFGYIDNIRTIFVRIMLLYCMYQYFFNYHNKYRYYSLLLISVHFAYFPIILLFFFSKYICFDFSRSFRVILVLALFVGEFLTDYINISSFITALDFGDTLNKRILVYTEGEWSSGGESAEHLSFAYKIYCTLASLSNYYLMYIFCKSRYNHKLLRYTIVLGLISLMTLSVPVLYGRYKGFFYFALALYILYGYCNGMVTLKRMKIYLLLCVFAVVLNIYAYWNCLVNGNLIYIFLPLPLALYQTYNFVEWRISHLDDNFDKIINGGFLSR